MTEISKGPYVRWWFHTKERTLFCPREISELLIDAASRGMSITCQRGTGWRAKWYVSICGYDAIIDDLAKYHDMTRTRDVFVELDKVPPQE